MSLFWTLFLHALSGGAQKHNLAPELYRKSVQLYKANPSNIAFYKTVKFADQNEWDSVLVQSQKSLAQTKSPILKDYLHFYRGMAFRRKKIYEPSENELKQVSPKFEFFISINLIRGEMALDKGKIDKALSYFLSVDTSNLRIIKLINIDALQHNIGTCYTLKGDLKLAENYLKRAIVHIQSFNDNKGLIACYTGLANVYYERYEDENAILYFKRAYDLAQLKGSNYDKQFTAQNMAIVEENRGQFEAAISYHKEFEAWTDSVNDQNKIYEVAQLEKKFAVDKKQKQVKLLRTENKLKQTERNMYLFAAILLGIILVFGSYLFRQNILRSRLILIQKQELDALNATKDQLFSIVSHDLRSSVHALRTSNTALRDKLTTKEYERLDELLEQNSGIATNTYNMLDNLLNWALLQTKGGYFKQESHRISMLVDQVAYNFRGILAQKGIEFENNLPKNVIVFVDAESIKIVLRNLMDNSIKFASDSGKISVGLIEKNESTILFSWKDNGKGMSESTRLKILSDSKLLTKKDHEKVIGSGLGMNLVKSMLVKNEGKLDIESELDKGTNMLITLKTVN